MTASQWLERGIDISRTVLQEARVKLTQMDEAPEPLVAQLDHQLLSLTDGPGTPQSKAALLTRCATSPVVFVGDFLTDPTPKQLVLEILASRPHAPLVITALPASFQSAIDGFLQQSPPAHRFFQDASLARTLPRVAWASLAPLLQQAHANGHPVILAEPEGQSLAKRQAAVMGLVARLTSKHQPVVLTGELRITDHALAALPPLLARRSLRIVTDAAGPYFSATARGENGTGFGTLREHFWYVQSQPPLTRILGFLHWLETETDCCHAPAMCRDFPRHVAAICRTLKLPPCPGADPAIFAPGDPRYLVAAKTRGGYSSEQMEHLALRFAANDSRYLPEANIVYIGQPAPAHVAEEAAHFIRTHLGGAGVGASIEDRFWSTTIHEIAGYIGSKVIVPRRSPPLLAPGITPEDFDAEARAHLYGYQMGERLWRRRKGNDSVQSLIEALFMQDLVEPGAAKGLYFASLNCVATRRRR